MMWFLNLLAALPSSGAVLAPRVVIVTTFPAEFARWKMRLPLQAELPFPGGNGELPLAWNGSLRVLGLVTGMTSKNASLSVTALGYDPRFDFSESTWLLAGIAGMDPTFGSIGAATWVQRLVDGTTVRYVDPREMPKDWETGWIPFNRDRPYGLPRPSESERISMTTELNAALVQWAHELTKSISLPDFEELRRARSHYAPVFPNAAKPPDVQMGDMCCTDVFWTGSVTASWARNWTRYWLPAADSWNQEGRLAVSAMEDFAVAQALDALHRAGRGRGTASLLVLRTSSNFIEPPPGHSVVISQDMFVDAACEAAYLVGSTVVHGLLSGGHRENWLYG
mmetsp:Transcript_34183/g.63767  ORF Transcript_34183/g.63767 Transcript_34183/m.63767 type:complete len:338 (-) Transcript_34183:16-1029(-)